MTGCRRLEEEYAFSEVPEYNESALEGLDLPDWTGRMLPTAGVTDFIFGFGSLINTRCRGFAPPHVLLLPPLPAAVAASLDAASATSFDDAPACTFVTAVASTASFDDDAAAACTFVTAAASTASSGDFAAALFDVDVAAADSCTIAILFGTAATTTTLVVATPAPARIANEDVAAASFGQFDAAAFIVAVAAVMTAVFATITH